MLFIKLTKESFLFTYQSLVANKLRTFLSLLGITIGIFAIISVFTVLNSLENSIRKNIESLGTNVVYIQKWPIIFEQDYPWWRFINRPVPKIHEVNMILERSECAQALAFQINVRRTVSYKNNSAENINILATSDGFDEIRNFEIERGRYLSSFELQTGKNSAVIGSEIAAKLFEGLNPLGRTFKISGVKMVVVGVFEKEGQDMFNNSTDELILIPVNFARTVINIRSEFLNPLIMARAKDHISTDQLVDELTGIMRAVRKLRPAQENNFALNTVDKITSIFDQIFITINLAGLIIGGFSILVGGFGIANIMFVSVRERTRIIGIQKSLGAKKSFILMQFLYEAITLSLIGGILGLILIFAGTLLVNTASQDFQISLTIINIIRGLAISVIIGVVSGFAPAYTASKLNPVEAISTV